MAIAERKQIQGAGRFKFSRLESTSLKRHKFNVSVDYNLPQEVE